MNKIEITKMLVKSIVGISVGYTVSNLIVKNSPTTKTSQKLEVIIGSFIISALVKDQAADYTDKKFDALFAWYNDSFNKTPTQ